MIRISLFFLCALVCLLLIHPSDVIAATFTVTNTSDSGAGSLRQAILDANGMSGYDDIVFAIPGAGVKTIMPLSELPWITDPVQINGFSQGGGRYKGPPIIELNGSLISNAAHGLTLYQTINSIIRGLIINQFNVGGIFINGGDGGHVIKSNYIGISPSGTFAKPNYTGINIFRSPNNQIGVGGRNVISGNDFNGIYIYESTGTVIQSNYIGTDFTGDYTIPNQWVGIGVEDSLETTIRSGNVISGNNRGIGIWRSPRTTVIGNYFCTDKTGNTQLGGWQTGVTIYGDDNQIGDPSPGASNVFQCYWVQVRVDDGIGNSIRGNSMFNEFNECLGINLGPDCTVTPNDMGDADVGPNNLQNFPVLFSALNSNGTTTISGELSSTPSTLFIIDFYSNPACKRLGKTHVGSLLVITDSSGYATFQSPLGVYVPAHQFITSTATKVESMLETSEFSECVEVWTFFPY